MVVYTLEQGLVNFLRKEFYPPPQPSQTNWLTSVWLPFYPQYLPNVWTLQKTIIYLHLLINSMIVYVIPSFKRLGVWPPHHTHTRARSRTHARTQVSTNPHCEFQMTTPWCIDNLMCIYVFMYLYRDLYWWRCWWSGNDVTFPPFSQKSVASIGDTLSIIIPWGTLMVLIFADIFFEKKLHFEGINFRGSDRSRIFRGY